MKLQELPIGNTPIVEITYIYKNKLKKFYAKLESYNLTGSIKDRPAYYIIKKAIENNLVDNNFHITPKKNDLYSFVRLEDINNYKNKLNLKRVKIIAQDGASDYIRPIINKMDEETFKIYLEYHLSICERKELLGASSHILDILKK